MAKFTNPYNQVPPLTQDTILESDKNTENITYKRTNWSVLSQQVTTRVQETDKNVLLRQTQNTNNKNDPQKKHHL